MAIQTVVTEPLFIGTDFRYVHTTYTAARTAIVDTTAWALSFVIKRRPTDSDMDAVFEKTTSNGGVVVSGTFNPDPGTNTQVATVTIADTDTDGVLPGSYHWEMKRTDPGFETILSYGTVELKRSLHRV
jgi:hypothetical protein